MNERWLEIASATGLVTAEGATKPTIFSEMSALALRFDAANLGQGFPDEDGPLWIREEAARAIMAGANQYPPVRGIASLRQAIAAHQERYYGINLDPEFEVLVTAGATEALTAAILAFSGPGDEVLTLEPFYDSHAAAITMSGATHTTVALRVADGEFRLDQAALKAAVTQRTKLILVNTPHNPTGTVLNREELECIAAEAKRVDAIVVTDEVYEHLTFDSAAHVPIATLPGMRDRTLTVSSAGKTFSLTGWKIGWVSGPANLIEAILTIKQFLTFSGGAPFQPAIARALADGESDIDSLRVQLSRRRLNLLSQLEKAGFDCIRPAGTYFVCADASRFLSDEVPNGAAFARWLPEHVGVACVPVSAFCLPGSPAADTLANWVRFTFVKDDATLQLSYDRLQKLSTQALR